MQYISFCAASAYLYYSSHGQYRHARSRRRTSARRGAAPGACINIFRMYLVCRERSSSFLRRIFEPFSRGKPMRWTFQSDTSSSCSPTPTLSTLPGAASEAAPEVLAPRPGGACCFRFLTRPPSSCYHCKTRVKPDSTAGSVKRAVCDTFCLLSRECGRHDVWRHMFS